MLKKFRKKWVAVIAIAVVILLTVIVPPNRSQVLAGSTYNRSPSGYGAWYEFMTAQGIKIERWQKPLQKLKRNSPITLIRIKPEIESVSYAELEWLNKGNNLVILGVSAKTTQAPFSELISSKVGNVKIETTRRRGDSRLPQPKENRPDEKLALGNIKSLAQADGILPQTNLLDDEFGIIVWKKESQGTFIASVTPYLAANAYQNEEGNFKFLASLLSNLDNSSDIPIYVDEYIHGYKDQNADENLEGVKSWIDYLISTPLFVGIVQAFVVLVIFIIANNRRFGAPIAPESVSINNSQAYIEALSSILQKAQRHEFVWQAIAKAEQKKLRQKLGISPQEDQEALVKAWVQQTGGSPAEIESLLNPPKTKINTQQLLIWLQNWQNIITSAKNL
ncbi:hypothetical protein Syn7502_00651 [Synechococcus sp. PCC 7502]|uniref:DUF4350 domain-containing protein n=1 Tax=Synechococcus sp. PCC 7502 TaxID=1173263 RepID=UPI00029FC323|nr:DUF4350 domain-containing protein [Synechococcus sp. PCC 7502]AFY72799.1 hypothetical protein Syn7502_00651 [Synechococcus sp. PCC 7502]